VAAAVAAAAAAAAGCCALPFRLPRVSPSDAECALLMCNARSGGAPPR